MGRTPAVSDGGFSRIGEAHGSTMDGKGQRKCTTSLELWRHIVLWEAEIGIGKKKLMDISKGW